MRNISLEDIGVPHEIPILGTAAGAHLKGARIITGRMTGSFKCPPHLAAFTGIYALYVEGESMLPQFAPGDLVIVNPHKPAKPALVNAETMRREMLGTAGRWFEPRQIANIAIADRALWHAKSKAGTYRCSGEPFLEITANDTPLQVQWAHISAISFAAPKAAPEPAE